MKKDRTLSYSSLKQFDISPNHLLAYWNRDLEQTSAQIKGIMIHNLLLESDCFFDKYAIFEGKIKRGKEYDAFLQENSSKTIISNKEYEDAMVIVKEVYNNANAENLLSRTHTTEQLIEWDAHGYKFKGIVDGIGNDFIFDLKTCASSEPKKFARDCYNYGYPLQAYMYSKALGVIDYYIIAVENSSPYNVVVYKMSNELMQYGKSEFERIMSKYDDWNGEPCSYIDSIETLELPNWVNTKEVVDRF